MVVVVLLLLHNGCFTPVVLPLTHPRTHHAQISLDEVFLAKEEIALAIKAELTKSMSGGY